MSCADPHGNRRSAQQTQAAAGVTKAGWKGRHRYIRHRSAEENKPNAPAATLEITPQSHTGIQNRKRAPCAVRQKSPNKGSEDPPGDEVEGHPEAASAWQGTEQMNGKQTLVCASGSAGTGPNPGAMEHKGNNRRNTRRPTGRWHRGTTTERRKYGPNRCRTCTRATVLKRDHHKSDSCVEGGCSC